MEIERGSFSALLFSALIGFAWQLQVLIILHPGQVVWGGRDVEQAYDDLWAFDLVSLEWEEWGLQSPEKPSVRNHLGGFVSDELIFIYGQSLSLRIALPTTFKLDLPSVRPFVDFCCTSTCATPCLKIIICSSR